ncbi:MAG TPA: alpha/beta fold hydrolase [Steroidobacteraceae bacterium]|jgi:phospholipase/carboxylesterase|nr:alpha/beta fold hydrolase [Steroidobacteraceae bacterium]
MKYETRQSPDAWVMNPATPATASVIWLHGLGADGTDFLSLVPQLGLPDTVAPRFIFPNAPVRPVTINNGMSMRAWYDVYSRDARGREDAASIQGSAALVNGLIDRQCAAGISSRRIVLAGFSQGGAIALQAGLRYPQALAGILALSTYLPLATTLADEASAANRAIPILICHGVHDPVLPLDLAHRSLALLSAQGYAPRLLEYPMQHSLCAAEVLDISSWLAQVLPPV